MDQYQMRTRFLNKMTNQEVEDYLERNDIIIVPVGTVETHGRYPLDIEMTMPEGIAKLMAEKVDGLVLGSLPYFYCGATTIGRGTIQMSVNAGAAYLKEIAYSLLNQGFRRQIYVSAHMPSFLTVGNVVIDFFDETKVPITYIDGVELFRIAQMNNPNMGFDVNSFATVDKLAFGAYRIMNRLDEIVIDPNAKVRDPNVDYMLVSNHTEDFNYIFNFSSCATGFYLSEPDDHGQDFGAVPSREVLEELSKEGEEMLRALVDAADMPRYVECMRNLDVYTNTFIKEKYGAHLPKNKFSDWK